MATSAAMNGDSVPGLEPRQEATPLAWEGDERRSLTGTQREAAERLWELMRFYLDHAQTQSRYHKDRHGPDGIGDVLPAIDDKRRSQVLLIDGDCSATFIFAGPVASPKIAH